MTTLPEFLNDAKCARSLVGCLPLKDVFRLRSLCPAVGSESIVKAFETDRAESVANAKVAVELGLGEPARHRGVGPNEMAVSIKFVEGRAEVPHDIVLYVPPPPPQGDASIEEHGHRGVASRLPKCFAANKRKRNPAGRAAELTADDFVRRVAGLVATGARSIAALEGAYEDEFKTAMMKDSTVLQGKGGCNKRCIQKLVTLIAEYGVSCHGQNPSYLPSNWKKWDFPRQKKQLRFFRET